MSCEETEDEIVYGEIAAHVMDDVVPAFMANALVIARETYKDKKFDVEDLRGILEITYRETFISDNFDSTLH